MKQTPLFTLSLLAVAVSQIAYAKDEKTRKTAQLS